MSELEMRVVRLERMVEVMVSKIMRLELESGVVRPKDLGIEDKDIFQCQEEYGISRDEAVALLLSK